MFVRIQKLKFSIYVNTNVMQVSVNIEKQCVIVFNKTKHIIQSTSMWTTLKNFGFFKSLRTRGSLMTQFTNIDIEKNLLYIFISNKILFIRKWSRKYTNKHSITKHLLKVKNEVILMLFSFVENCTDYRSRDIMMMKLLETFFTHIKWFMLHQVNGKNLSTKSEFLNNLSNQWPVVINELSSNYW